uniref:E74-like factor 3 (ets domain transcription factor, epithelial-specific ) n=1 Tax=Cyprinodon variegatus TaxID=28743 RepID=A0A3Q2EBM3_CYPVA
MCTSLSAIASHGSPVVGLSLFASQTSTHLSPPQPISIEYAHTSAPLLSPCMGNKKQQCHVLEWISDHVENTKFDASTLSLAFCSMDGLSLCRMNQEEMTRTFGPQLGPHLHQSLEEYKTEHGKLKPSRLAHLIKQTNVLSDGRKLTNSSTSPELQNLPGPELKAQLVVLHILAAPRGTHLWEFIRDILIHPEKNQGLMKWEDRREGVFKFLKSEAVAQMWGQKKKNTSMTYEKLSRAMRYYYKREILERVDGRRLVYKFGKNSSGWKIEEIGASH